MTCVGPITLTSMSSFDPLANNIEHKTSGRKILRYLRNMVSGPRGKLLKQPRCYEWSRPLSDTYIKLAQHFSLHESLMKKSSTCAR